MTETQPTDKQATARPARWPWIALCLIILFDVAIRVRLLNLPLERDEGEFAYVAQLMLDGVPPYKLAYVIKLPGTPAAYALSMALFGQTALGIHLGLLLANVSAIILVFLLARRWFDSSVGVFAAATYALMSLSWAVGGNAAHATQFIAPVAIGGVLLLERAVQSGNLAALFCSGLLFGFSFLLKQPGIFFGAYGGFFLLANELKQRPVSWTVCLKRCAVYCLGILLPFAALCLILWRAAVFDRFWYWSFKVAGGGWTTLRDGWDNFIWWINWTKQSGQLMLWIAAAVVAPFVFWMPLVRPVRWRFLAFCGVSIFAGCVGWRFNPHYFVPTLPAIGMIIGLGLVEGRRRLKSETSLFFLPCLPVAAFVVICVWALYVDRGYFFTLPLDQVAARIYRGNPFREAVQVADYIKKNSSPGSQVAVLGSEPEIYFYAHRRSATGHVSTYILMERQTYSHAMQEEMIREIEAARPEYIVFIENSLSWFPPPDHADNTLTDTMFQYLKEHYQRVGMAVSAPAPDPPAYYWEADARKPQGETKPGTSFTFVYKIQPATFDNPPKT